MVIALDKYMPCKPLNDIEVSLILNTLQSPRDKALFVLGVKSGFRISELLSLTVADVQGDTLTVRRCNMKGKSRARTVPLHPLAKGSLKEYVCMLKEDAVLFPITRQHAWRIIRGAALQAGIQGRVSTHSMRKTFGMSVYRRSGKDLKAAQLALGHKSLQSTGHYLSVDQETIDKLILES